MRWLLFLSRLAFICGLFLLIAVSLLINDWIKDVAAVSTIITIGYFMGMIILPFTNLCYLAVLLIRRKLKPYVPLWLVLANLCFFFFLIYFIFYLNDPHYHQK
jgi:hypothetical protein